jgi:hypothetical protein
MADTIDETAVPETGIAQIADEEKQEQYLHAENSNDCPIETAGILAIDPTIEKRVLKKLDKRVPVLLGFLCGCHFSSN